MELSAEHKAILNGTKGKTLAKVLETLVSFGEVFGAERLVPVTHSSGHLVTSFGLGLLKPLFSTMDKLIEDGIKVKGNFTIDPRPLDVENVPYNLLERFVNEVIMYAPQKHYEEQLKAVGLKDENAFSCACYLDEVGNIPKKGDILSWAESSAVVYANSVLGARCNRNSGMLDLFGSIIGAVPEFGLLTDEGRKATWIVKINCSKLPEAQILGSAIGMKVVEDVPFVYGLDKFLGTDLTDEAKSYLKDFGAATASNGAVGLYHINNLTPEAKELGEKLIAPNAKVYEIDDAELERVYRSYPNMWKNPDAKIDIAFIGCPHLSFSQLNDWTEKISDGLQVSGRSKVAFHTIACAPPDVVEKFKKTENYRKLIATGTRLTSICPLMYTSNPLTKSKAIATCSNKLRTYSVARYYKTEDLLDLICGKK